MRVLLIPKLSQKPGLGGWSQDGGAWASDQQLVGRRPVEGRSSLKSVSPGALMGLLPSGDAGGACSGSVSTWDPLTKPQHHGVLKSPDGVPNSDTVVLQRNKKVKSSS